MDEAVAFLATVEGPFEDALRADRRRPAVAVVLVRGVRSSDAEVAEVLVKDGDPRVEVAADQLGEEEVLSCNLASRPAVAYRAVHEDATGLRIPSSSVVIEDDHRRHSLVVHSQDETRAPYEGAWVDQRSVVVLVDRPHRPPSVAGPSWVLTFSRRLFAVINGNLRFNDQNVRMKSQEI